MKRLHNWVNRLSLKNKIILYAYMVIAPVLLVICLILFFLNYDQRVRQEIENDSNSVNALADSLSVLQQEIYDLSTYICINQDITDILKNENAELLNQDARLWLNHAPMQIVQDMIAQKGYVRTLSIYPENGVNPYLRCTDHSSYISSLEQIRDTENYKTAMSLKGQIFWRSASKGEGDIYQNNRTEKIVLCRELFDLAKKTPLAYITIGVDEEKFRKLCMSAVQEEEEGVLVLSSDGMELISFGEIPDGVLEYLQQDSFLEVNYKERSSNMEWGKYNIVNIQKERNGNIVCKIVRSYSSRTTLSEIAYMPLLLMGGLLIGIFPLLMIISKLITKPLGRVCEAIDRFSRGDFEQQMKVETGDEIGQVAECFNKMVRDIKELINTNYVITLREKESELATLQAQINPHFLYNTLDSLYWQASGEGNEEIAENILALSQLFRLVLGQGKGIITVAQETELVSRYLQIQKMRFTKRLNYEIHVDERINDAPIPKLVIQPFVENAIVHGFENTSIPCFLEVGGYFEEDAQMMRFEIRDTGIGMNQAQIEQIWEDDRSYAKQRVGSYAIKNIRERLELNYHGNFQLQIKSAVGQGTTVILRLPTDMKRGE